MLVRLAELAIDPDRLEAYLALLREEIEASVALEAGVIAPQAARLGDRPAAIRLLGACADGEACEAHLRSPHVLRDKAATGGMVLSLRLLEAEPVLLRARPGFGGATEPR